MPEVVVLSGKGGTGKTSITGCFVALANNPIIADCDVDAANLHLLLNPQVNKIFDFYGGVKAEIMPDQCKRCNACVKVCNFNAISHYQVDTIACEGCGVCFYSCPYNAIKLNDHISGQYYLSESSYGPMVHGDLGIAEGNSGKLVAEIKSEARKLIKNQDDLIIIDGPPGIGCPVISSLSGADYAVIVTEPSVSGVHDLKRIVQLIKNFNIPIAVIINKSDLSVDNNKRIKHFCKQMNIEIAGEIKYNKIFVEALYKAEPVVKYNPTCDVSLSIKQIWEKISKLITT